MTKIVRVHDCGWYSRIIFETIHISYWLSNWFQRGNVTLAIINLHHWPDIMITNHWNDISWYQNIETHQLMYFWLGTTIIVNNIIKFLQDSTKRVKLTPCCSISHQWYCGMIRLRLLPTTGLWHISTIWHDDIHSGTTMDWLSSDHGTMITRLLTLIFTKKLSPELAFVWLDYLTYHRKHGWTGIKRQITSKNLCSTGTQCCRSLHVLFRRLLCSHNLKNCWKHTEINQTKLSL